MSANRHPRYTAYKSSGNSSLGEVPADWQVSRIAHVFVKSNAGEVIDKSYWGDGEELLYTCNRTPMRSDFSVFPRWKRTLKNDLLLTRNGTPYVHKPTEGAIYSNVVQRITLADQFSREYLSYCLGNSALGMRGYGVSIESFNFDNWKSLRFAHPPLEEQTQISKFLDYETAKIDALIEKQQQLIALLEEKRRAVISHAVTKGLNPDAPMRDSGVEWLGEVPAHWEIGVKLALISDSSKGSFVNGPFGSDLLASELTDAGVPVVYIRDVKPTGYFRKSTNCVSQQKAEQLDVCRVDPGNILVAKVGDPPGDACVYPDGEPVAVITQDVIRIRVDEERVVPNYLVHLLNSDFGRAAADGVSVESTRKRVGLGDYKQLRFALPPLDEQSQIASFINGRLRVLDSLISNAETGIELLQERRTALISAAVTGKIDVRGWKAPDSESQAEVA